MVLAPSRRLYNPRADQTICSFFTEVADGILQATAPVPVGEALAEIREQLLPYEIQEPVPILEFVESDAYLGLGGYVYPAGLWVLDTFYNPQNHFEDSRYEWRGRSGVTKELVYPGFGSLGFSQEEVNSFYFNDLSMMIGQRSLKSVVSAIIVLYETFKLLNLPDPATHYGLMPGTPISVSVAATAQKQAQQTVYYYVEQWRDRCRWFQRYIEKAKALKMPDGKPVYTQTRLDWSFEHKSIQIDALHAKSGSLRGATRLVGVIDEIAHFDEGEHRNASEVYAAVMNATMSFEDEVLKSAAKRVCISSPLHIQDMINQLVAQSGVLFQSPWYATQSFELMTEVEGRPIEKNMGMLAFHYPTWEINPTLPYSIFKQRLRSSPEKTNRDFGALPSYAVEAYFKNPEKITAVFDPGLPCPIDEFGRVADTFKPKAGTKYQLHVDVGAGRPCNFGMCLAHPEVEQLQGGEQLTHMVVDLAYAVKAEPNGEIDFRKAREILDIIISRFPIECYSSDGWNDLEYAQKIRRRGIKTEQFNVDDTHYSELRTFIYEGRCRCHYAPLAELELKRLELKNGKKIEKGVDCTKDIADCMAAVALRCVAKTSKRLASGRATTGLMSR